MPNNIELVRISRAMIGNPYWYGTYSQTGSEQLLSDCAKRYPNQFSKKRIETAKARGDFGKRVMDCSGLIKNVLMGGTETATPVYNAQFDLSANSFHTKATEKGSIKDIPEIIGLGLWKNNHVGVYIGGGKCIEAKGFDYGVVESELANTAFVEWFKIPFIDYVMYSDGASVYDVKNKKVIYNRLIPFEITRDIIEYLNTTEVYYNIYLDGQIATQKGRQRYGDLLSEISGKSVELIVGFFNTQQEYLASRKFIDRFSDRLYITSAFRNEFEMTDINATKGKTMAYLCELNSITSSQVIAFGDSGNDLPLLEFAGVSVAMGNAEENVKQIADYVTETNALDGVAVAVEKFVLNN